jgi:hypothetical protein
MSMDLKVKLNRSFSTIDLFQKTNQNLKEILNLEVDFTLFLTPNQEFIKVNENFATVARAECFNDEIVELTILYQESVVGYEDPDEDGWWAISTIRSANIAPMKYALAAALSISLAQIQNTLILDENNIWSDKSKIKSEDFLNKLTNPLKPESLNQALEAFLKRIYH